MLQHLIIFFSLLLMPFHILHGATLVEVAGIDGSGKTTFIKALGDALTAQGKKVIILSPLRGDSSVYGFLDKIEDIKNNTSKAEIHDRIDRFKSGFFLLSFLTYGPLIKTLDSEYDFIICDRYLFSFRTYQEAFNQLEDSDEALLGEMPNADITLMLTVPIDLAIKRLQERGKMSAYENPAFLERAQTIFLRDAGNYQNLFRINGEEEWELKVEKALAAIEEVCPKQ